MEKKEKYGEDVLQQKEEVEFKEEPLYCEKSEDGNSCDEYSETAKPDSRKEMETIISREIKTFENCEHINFQENKKVNVSSQSGSSFNKRKFLNFCQKCEYSCKICKKSFKSKHILKLHLLNHSNVKPFSCNLCNYFSATKSNLKRHMLTHSNDRPFGLKDYYRIVLNKLQDCIKHEDPKVAAARRLAIERWVRTYIRNVEYLTEDELKFLYNVFSDESCWLGARLNREVIGGKLIEEKIDGRKNPISKYEMACRYCVVDKVDSLFLEKFGSCKSSFPPNALDSDGKPVNDKYIRNLLLSSMKSKDPVLTFWIDNESGKLKEPQNNKEAFKKAVELKWIEGVEYFHCCLSNEGKEIESLMITAANTLSSVQCNQNDAAILDFCVRNIDDNNTLLDKLSQKDKGLYSLLSALTDWGFLDTVESLVQDWCCEERISVAANKIFSDQDYTLFLLSLSDAMLKSPELGLQARAVMMNLWECNLFDKNKKAAVDTSSGTVPMKGALAGLIVDWKRDSSSDPEKRNKILEILSFARNCFPENFAIFKENMIRNLRLVGREGMKEDVDYSKSAEELFSQLKEK